MRKCLNISGGFLAVYSTSLGFTVLGILYIWLIPESVTKRSHVEEKVDLEGTDEEDSEVVKHLGEEIPEYPHVGGELRNCQNKAIH